MSTETEALRAEVERLRAERDSLRDALHKISDAGEKAAQSYPGDGWRLAHDKFSAFARAALSKVRP